MSEIKLNLARKWRSENFEQIVGQELPVRMLKNSLFLGQYFPVYLFSGQRGCGKTTTARVFASALNCEQLSLFRKNPKKYTIPCRACTSCDAMKAGKHPDFIEMDAASHTGVDNVRQIIDSSSLMPLMGQKKIYLIDEAHMLSKSAFNALLKILEEPPPSVLFVLATTDPQKIIETVKSRCFQLFFKPIEDVHLLHHLQHVCEQESIVSTHEGLEYIVYQTQGSARDALNLLEQVRFSSKQVTPQAVQQVLGHIDDRQLITIVEYVFFKSPTALLSLLKDVQFRTYSADFMWHRLIELVRVLMWMKYRVSLTDFAQHHDMLQALAKKCSLAQLHTFLQALYNQELMFAKSTEQHTLLEMLFLRLCARKKKIFGDGGSTPQTASGALPLEHEECDQEEFEDEDLEIDQDEDDDEVLLWKKFLLAIQHLEDPLLRSIFQQGTVKRFDVSAGVLHIEFPQNLIFFQDWLSQTSSDWMPLLTKLCAKKIAFTPMFTGKKVSQTSLGKKVSESFPPPQPTQKPQSPAPKKSFASGGYQAGRSNYKRSFTKIPQRPRGKVVDVSDAAHWQKAQLLLRYFPGTVTECIS